MLVLLVNTPLLPEPARRPGNGICPGRENPGRAPAGLARQPPAPLPGYTTGSRWRGRTAGSAYAVKPRLCGRPGAESGLARNALVVSAIDGVPVTSCVRCFRTPAARDRTDTEPPDFLTPELSIGWLIILVGAAGARVPAVPADRRTAA